MTIALFHFHVTQIKRSTGQSAVAAAAYRSGEKLHSEYYGEDSDYTRKGGVICSEILLPAHAPQEYADRETLWNAVEKVERGKKAQLAYSFDIALQAYFDRRNAGAYSQKARINNLKEMNVLFNYLMENGIHDLSTLETRVDALRESSDALKTKLDSQTARMKEIRKLLDYLATYHEMKPVYDGLQKIKFTRSKEKYKSDHAAELKQFYEARRKLSAEFPDGKFDRQKLDAEYARLEQEHEATYAQFKSIRADSQQL